MMRAAQRLMLEVEKSVSDFPRKHRYLLGADLRKGAESTALVASEAFRAWKNPERCAGKLESLSDSIDAVKLRLQVAYDLQAFPSHGRFTEVAEIAHDLGRQCGAALRSVKKHLMGQSPAASAPLERAPILSTRATSSEVIP